MNTPTKDRIFVRFPLGREHMVTLRDLKNRNLVITRPEKGNAKVVMNRQEYVK